jgi:hypothetical protein
MVCADELPVPPEGFRVKTKVRQQLANRKRRIERRLDLTPSTC